MAELPPRYPSSLLTNESLKKVQNRQEKKGKEKKMQRSMPAAAAPPSLPSFVQELPDFSHRQEVHHHLITLVSGKQLRDLHESAFARFPARRLSPHFPQCFVLLSPPAAVAEEVFPHLGRPPSSTTAPPAFVALTMAEPF